MPTFWGGRGRGRGGNRGGAAASGSRGGRGTNYGRGGRGGANGGQGQRMRGLFVERVWHCDCDPRLPAERFQVKKEGKNKGRYFYTCQKQDRCGFFLWEDDAKPREEAAVLSNSRSEPAASEARARQSAPAQEGWNAGRSTAGGGKTAAPITIREDSTTASEGSPPPPRSSRTPASKAGKRNAAVAFDDDEDFDWHLTGQEAEELAQAADSAALQTPNKAQKIGVYATPATTTKRRLPWLDEPPKTPTTASKPGEGYFDTPTKVLPSKSTATANGSAYDLISPPKSSAAAVRIGALKEPITPRPPQDPASGRSPPSTTRYKDAFDNPADAASSLTSEVMTELSGTPLPSETKGRLRSILTRHDLKTQGIAMGRDVSRKALKAKDAKIAELQAKIASLEAEREVDRGVIRQLRWDKEHGQARS